MNLQSYFATFAQSDTNEEIFITRQQHLDLENYVKQLFELQNIQFQLRHIFLSFDLPQLQDNDRISCRQYYVALYFALSALRRFPSFLHPSDNSDNLGKKFSPGKKKTSRHLEICDQIGNGGHEVLLDFVTYSLKALDFVKIKAQKSEFVKQSQRSLFGKEYLSQWDYQARIGQNDYCQFNVDKLLSIELKTVYQIALDVIGCIRCKNSIKIVQSYIKRYTKNLKTSIKKQFTQADYQSCTGILISNRSYEFPYLAIICGGLLGSLGSIYSQSIGFYIQIYIQEVSRKKNEKDLQCDNSCISSVMQEFQAICLNLTQDYFDNLQSFDFSDFAKSKDVQITQKFIESKYDIVFYDTFHYLISSILIPLKQLSVFYLQQNQNQSQYFQYSFYIKLNQQFTTNLQQIFQLANVGLSTNDTINRLTGKQLNFFEVFKLLTINFEEQKAQVTSKPATLQCLLHTLWPSNTLLPDQLVHLFDYDNIIFDFADIIQYAMVNYKIEDLKQFLFKISEKKQVLVQIECIAWLSILRGFILGLQYFHADRNIIFYQAAKYQLSYMVKDYDHIERNSYFPSMEQSEYIDQQSIIQEIADPNAIFQDIYLDNILNQTIQTQLHPVSESNISKIQIITFINTFITDQVFDSILTLCDHYQGLSFSLLEGLFILLQLTNYFTTQKLNYVTACKIVNVIFKTQTIAQKQLYLLKMLIELTPEFKLVFCDIIASFSLYIDQGYSIVIQKHLQISEQQVQTKTEEDEFLEMVFNEINEFSKLSSFLTSSVTENEITRPFQFLKGYDKQVIQNISILCGFFSQSQFQGSSLHKYVVDFKDNPIRQFDIIITISWFTSYLLGECLVFKPETQFLEQLALVLPTFKSNLSKSNQNLLILERCFILKLAILKVLNTLPTQSILESFKDILEQSVNLSELLVLLQKPLQLDTFANQQQILFSQRYLIQFFLSSLKNDLASSTYQISNQFSQFSTLNLNMFANYIKPPLFLGQPGSATPECILSLAFILSNDLFDKLPLIVDNEIQFMSLQLQTTETEIIENQTDSQQSSGDLLVQSVVFYSQNCQNFYKATKLIIFIKMTLSKGLKLLYQIILLSYSMFNKHVYTSQKLQQGKNLKFQLTIIIFLQAVQNFLQLLQDQHIPDQSWVYTDSQQFSINLYDLLLQNLVVLYQYLQDDVIRESIALTLKQLVILLDSQPLQLAVFYDLDFILSIQKVSVFKQSELTRIVKSGFINQEKLQDYFHIIVRQENPFILIHSLLQLSIQQINLSIAYEQSQSINIQINQKKFTVSNGFIFILCFMKEFEFDAQKIFEQSIIITQRFNISQQIIEILEDLIYIYEQLRQMKSDQIYSQNMIFIEELFNSNLLALQYIFTKVNFTQQNFSVKFLDIIFSQVQLLDMSWFVELQLSTDLSFIELAKQQQFEINKIFIQLLPVLCLSDKNNKFILNYSLHTLYKQEFMPLIVQKIVILVQSLFISNPMKLIEDFNNMLFKYPSQAAIIISCLSYKNQNDTPIFYQYLFKGKLNFSKFFEKYLFEISKSSQSDDSLSEDSIDDSTFSKKHLHFNEDHTYRAIKKYIDGEQKHPQLEKDVNEYKNNANNFMLSGIKSLILINLTQKKLISQFIQQLIVLYSVTNDYVLLDIDEFISQVFNTHIRACADFCGYSYPSHEFQFNYHNTGNAKNQLNVRLMKKFVESMRNAFFFDTNHLIALKYQQQISGNQFIVQPFTDASKTITFQYLFPKILESVFPKMWPDFLIINVDVIFYQLCQFITNNYQDDSLPLAIQSIQLQRFDENVEVKNEPWSGQKLQCLNLIVSILHQLSIARDNSYIPSNGLVNSVYDIHIYLISNISSFPESQKSNIILRSLDAIQYLLSSPKQLISTLFPQIISQTAIALPKPEIGVYCARLSGHLIQEKICFTPQIILLYAALFMMLGKEANAFQFILQHQSYFLYSIDKDKQEEIDQKCQTDDCNQIIKDVYYELCKYYELQEVVEQMLAEKFKEYD